MCKRADGVPCFHAIQVYTLNNLTGRCEFTPAAVEETLASTKCELQKPGLVVRAASHCFNVQL